MRKKITCHLADFAILAGYRVKIKENEKNREILGSCKKAERLWNLRVTVIPIVVGGLGTLLKNLDELEIRGSIETI